MLEVVRVGEHLHKRAIAKVASFIDFAFIHTKLEEIVEGVFCQVVVIVDEDVLLRQIGANVGKLEPEHRVANRLAAEVIRAVQHGANCLNGALHTVLVAVKLPALDYVVTQHFVRRDIALFDFVFRIFLRTAFGFFIDNVETVESLAHFDLILLVEHLAAVEILVGFEFAGGQQFHYQAEKALLIFSRFLGIVKRHILDLIQVELAIYHFHPHKVSLRFGSFLVEFFHAEGHTCRTVLGFLLVFLADYLAESGERNARQKQCSEN